MSSGRARIAALTLGLCAAPYVGLRLYLALGMHGTAVEAALPSAWILGGLFALGVVVPSAGLGLDATAAAMAREAPAGSERAAAIVPQKRRKSRRETPWSARALRNW